MDLLEKIDMMINSINEDDTAYQKFFKEKLEKYGVSSPSELDDKKKKEFFAEVKKDWKG